MPRITNDVSYRELTKAIAQGIIDGSAQQVSDRQRLEVKVSEIDKELVLVKGVLVSLVGKGDGESGLVPRLERDMTELKTDVTKLKGSVEGVHARLGGMEDNIKTMMDAQTKQANQTSWTDGWRGVAAFFVALAAVFAVIGGLVFGVLWLAKSQGITATPREKVTYARPI